jgi:hypothetical protein
MSIMQTKLSVLLNSLNSQTLLLPEIQRDFVWKRNKVITLLDSLFADFPIGSMLVWKTQLPTDTVRTKAVQRANLQLQTSELISGYLLDGQQRLTALLKALNDEIPIRFHLVDGSFEAENRKNRTNPLCVLVADAIKGKVEASTLLEDLKRADLLSDERLILSNLLRLRDILNRHVAVLQYSSDSYSNATKLFIRFNSGGVELRQSELAIAKLALAAPSLISEQMRKFSAKWQVKGYVFTIPFLTRCLAVIRTGSVRFNKPEQIWDGSSEEIFRCWQRTQNALEKTVYFLSSTMHWDSTAWLSSYNALIPIVYMLGRRKSRKQLPVGERRLLRRWLSLVTVRGRYSGATETKLDADIRKMREQCSSKELWGFLNKNDKRKITLGEIQEATRSGALMALYYSMLKEKGARDWRNGTKIDGNILGFNASLEVHHIFPKSLLYRDGWKPEWINTMANYALLQKNSNIEIGNQLPSEYLGSGQIYKIQCIPPDKKLWTLDEFERFSNCRERMLQQNMNAFLGL